jgi:hypothetical protein
MKTSHRIRISPVVCDTANATAGGTGTTMLLSTTGTFRGYLPEIVPSRERIGTISGK